ncbi:amidase domain-containing protein [Paenibacillus chitinolyticus]
MKRFTVLILSLFLMLPASLAGAQNSEDAALASPKNIERFLVDYATKKNSDKKTLTNETQLTAESYDFYVFLNNLFWDTDPELKKLPEFKEIMKYAETKLEEKSKKPNTTPSSPVNELIQPLNSDYNRTQAVNYAKAWVKPGAKYRNTGNYPDFDLDCTNFASQAWVAGGNIIRKPASVSTGYYTTTSYWYALVTQTSPIGGVPTAYGWSTSWSVVDDFQAYWKSRGQSVYSASQTGLNTIISNAELGDIVQYKAAGSSRPTHSMVVTKKANGTIYLTYHSGPNNLDVLDNDIKNISEKETWYLVKF